jgi:hypothetical protein
MPLLRSIVHYGVQCVQAEGLPSLHAQQSIRGVLRKMAVSMGRVVWRYTSIGQVEQDPRTSLNSVERGAVHQRFFVV